MKKKITLSIGSFLKKARLAKKLSQAELASILGYQNSQYISDWERGYSPIPLKRILDLSEALNIDSQVLFDLLVDLSKERLERDLQKKFDKLQKRNSSTK
jgi:transcriptional regulator with XRE-family HTH domain